MTIDRLSIACRQTALALACLLWTPPWGLARDFASKVISEPGKDSRNPSIGETGIIAWQGTSAHIGNAPTSTRVDVLNPSYGAKRTDIYYWKNGEVRNVTSGDLRIPGRSERPQVFRDSIIFTAWFRDDADGGYPFELVVPPKNDEMKRMESEYPDLFDPPLPAPKSAFEAAADAEDGAVPEPEPLVDSPPPETAMPIQNNPQEGHLQQQVWRGSSKAGDIAVYRPEGLIERITPGTRHFGAPVMSEAGIACQVARGWPYGYEILSWKPGDTTLTQLTTNYFYVLNPDIHASELVYQGWDGIDYEIFRYRFDTGLIEQITNNQFDDTDPVVWNGEIAWISHPTVNAEIFHMRDGVIRKISEDSEDNSTPSIWKGRVVWQGYDDTDLEIHYFDGKRTIKLTSNTWDDIAPKIRDGVIVWMSYVGNGDSEIMGIDLGDNIAVQLTDNDWEDSFPRTAGERIVWQTLSPDGSSVVLAEPKAPRTTDVN